MIGITQIKNLTAQLTDNEALRDQLLNDMSTLYDDMQSSKTSAQLQSMKSEDLLCEANICDQMGAQCEQMIEDTETARANFESKTNAECEQECERLENETYNSKIHLQKFFDESGMCGMGMGMGSSYTEDGAIDLTVREIEALQGVLLEIGDSTETFDSNFESVEKALNDRFEKDGTNSHASIGSEGGLQFIEICREDGSSVKIYDANGNGALDTKDYNFSQAIEQACKMVSEMKDKIACTQAEAQSKIDESNKAAAELKQELSDQKANLEQQAADNRAEANQRQQKADSLLMDASDSLDEYNETEEEVNGLEQENSGLQSQIDTLSAQPQEETEEAEGEDQNNDPLMEEDREKEPALK